MHCCACLQPLRRQVDKIGEGHLPAAAAPAQLVAIAGQLGVANGQASQVIEDCEEHLQGESEHPPSVLIGQHPAGSEHQEQAGCSSCVMLGGAEEILGGAEEMLGDAEEMLADSMGERCSATPLHSAQQSLWDAPL